MASKLDPSWAGVTAGFGRRGETFRALDRAPAAIRGDLPKLIRLVGRCVTARGKPRGIPATLRDEMRGVAESLRLGLSCLLHESDRYGLTFPRECEIPLRLLSHYDVLRDWDESDLDYYLKALRDVRREIKREMARDARDSNRAIASYAREFIAARRRHMASGSMADGEAMEIALDTLGRQIDHADRRRRPAAETSED